MKKELRRSLKLHHGKRAGKYARYVEPWNTD
jgi:hypothetical protein